MKRQDAFLTGILLGGGISSILVSLAWDQHCITHREEIHKLLGERFQLQADVRLLEREGKLGGRKRGK